MGDGERYVSFTLPKSGEPSELEQWVIQAAAYKALADEAVAQLKVRDTLAAALEALVKVAGGGPGFFEKVADARTALRLVGRP